MATYYDKFDRDVAAGFIKVAPGATGAAADQVRAAQARNQSASAPWSGSKQDTYVLPDNRTIAVPNPKTTSPQEIQKFWTTATTTTGRELWELTPLFNRYTTYYDTLRTQAGDNVVKRAQVNLEASTALGKQGVPMGEPVIIRGKDPKAPSGFKIVQQGSGVAVAVRVPDRPSWINRNITPILGSATQIGISVISPAMGALVAGASTYQRTRGDWGKTLTTAGTSYAVGRIGSSDLGTTTKLGAQFVTQTASNKIVYDVSWGKAAGAAAWQTAAAKTSGFAYAVKGAVEGDVGRGLREWGLQVGVTTALGQQQSVFGDIQDMTRALQPKIALRSIMADFTTEQGRPSNWRSVLRTPGIYEPYGLRTTGEVKSTFAWTQDKMPLSTQYVGGAGARQAEWYVEGNRLRQVGSPSSGIPVDLARVQRLINATIPESDYSVHEVPVYGAGNQRVGTITVQRSAQLHGRGEWLKFTPAK